MSASTRTPSPKSSARGLASWTGPVLIGWSPGFLGDQREQARRALADQISGGRLVIDHPRTVLRSLADQVEAGQNDRVVRGPGGVTAALEIRVTAPVVSFRNPLYSGVQVGLPCPPPSTVGGFLASAAGGWQRMPPGTRFAMTFTARGSGTDLETYHPLDARGTASDPTPKDREFLADVTLTIWLIDDLDLWETALRRPVWPLRLGRSQDLAAARTRTVELDAGPGRQGQAVVPAGPDRCGDAAATSDRDRRGSVPHSLGRLPVCRNPRGCHRSTPVYVTEAGQAVALLPPAHPSRLDEGGPR